MKEEEEHADVASPATPPLSYVVAELREETDDDNKDWHAQQWWQQPAADGWWAKVEPKHEQWDRDWWQYGKQEEQEVEGIEWDKPHGVGNTSWGGRGSSRSASSSTSHKGFYVHGGWVGPDQKFYPMPAFKAVPLFFHWVIVVGNLQIPQIL